MDGSPSRLPKIELKICFALADHWIRHEYGPRGESHHFLWQEGTRRWFVFRNFTERDSLPVHPRWSRTGSSAVVHITIKANANWFFLSIFSRTVSKHWRTLNLASSKFWSPRTLHRVALTSVTSRMSSITISRETSRNTFTWVQRIFHFFSIYSQPLFQPALTLGLLSESDVRDELAKRAPASPSLLGRIGHRLKSSSKY